MIPRRHIPNALTVLRLLLTAVFVAALTLYDRTAPTAPWLLLAVGLFVVAALTDALDGYLARRWSVESRFGRVMDPVADKLLILGGFILLAGPDFAATPETTQASDLAASPVPISGVAPWMAVVMLVRELLVTSLRGAMESAGQAFGALPSGKAKMILQSVCIPVVLVSVALQWRDPRWTTLVPWQLGLVWLTVAVTAISGLPYVRAAMDRSRSA